MSTNKLEINVDLLPEFIRYLPSEPDVEVVVSWLKDLPMANAPKVCEIFLAFLGTLNAKQIVPSLRYAMLEAMWPALEIVSPVLDTHFMDRGFPLDAHPRKMADLSLQCYVELSKSYKHIADDVDFSNDRVLTKEQRVVTLTRSLHACALVQTRIAQLYEAPFLEFWQDTYDIFLKAESMGLDGESIRDNESTNGCNSTIANLFKRILLFSLSNPNRYRQRHHAQITSLIEQFVGLSEVGENASVDGRKATFFVDLEGGAPRHLSHMDDEASSNTRFLFTRSMVEEIVANVQTLASSSQQPTLNRKLERSLVFRVIRSLGAPERRKSMRVSENDKRTLLIGMQSIVDAIIDSRYRTMKQNKDSMGSNNSKKNLFMDHESECGKIIEGSAEESPMSNTYQYGWGDSNKFVANVEPDKVPDYELLPVDDGWENPAKDTRVSEHRSESSMARWFSQASSEQLCFDDIWGATAESLNNTDDPIKSSQSLDPTGKLVNSSVTGYSMVWLDNGPAKIKVGELISFPLEDNRFELGMVCWIFNSDGGDLSFGIELLSPSADVIKFNRSASSGTSDYGVLLSEVSAAEDGMNILLPPLDHKTIDSFDIEVDGRQEKFRLGKLVEATGTYNRFSLVKIESDGQQVG